VSARLLIPEAGPHIGKIGISNIAHCEWLCQPVIAVGFASLRP